MKNVFLIFFIVSFNSFGFSNCEIEYTCRLKTTRCTGAHDIILSHQHFTFSTQYYFKYQNNYICLDHFDRPYRFSKEVIQTIKTRGSKKHLLSFIPQSIENIPVDKYNALLENLLNECNQKRKLSIELYRACDKY